MIIHDSHERVRGGLGKRGTTTRRNFPADLYDPSSVEKNLSATLVSDWDSRDTHDDKQLWRSSSQIHKAITTSKGCHYDDVMVIALDACRLCVVVVVAW